MSHDSILPERDTVARVQALSSKELDALPFGVIQIDAAGIILSYNIAEAKISGREPEQVIGKNFFTEVAPCTNVQEFSGRFREGFAQRELNHVFPFLFDFQMQPARVWVRLHYSKATETGWVFVTRDHDAD